MSDSPPRLHPKAPNIHPQITKCPNFCSSHVLNLTTNLFTPMAISTSSSFFTSPNFSLNSNLPSHSTPTSVRFGRARISAAYATAERTATATISYSRNASPSSLYEVLGVRIGADIGEVKAAYRRLARVLHPDVGKSESSADEFMKVHSAYSTLADPVKRADYDRSLVLMRSAGSYRSRRWETDQCW